MIPSGYQFNLKDNVYVITSCYPKDQQHPNTPYLQGFQVHCTNIAIIHRKRDHSLPGPSWGYPNYYIQREHSRITYETSLQSTTWLYPHRQNYLRQR